MKQIIERLNKNFDLKDFKDWKMQELTKWISGYFKADRQTAKKVAVYIIISNRYFVFYNPDCCKYGVKTISKEYGYLHYPQVAIGQIYTQYEKVAERWRMQLINARLKKSVFKEV